VTPDVEEVDDVVVAVAETEDDDDDEVAFWCFLGLGLFCLVYPVLPLLDRLEVDPGECCC
jgi:hypothetical protein